MLGDPRLRRRYDRNTLGRTFSAADVEIAKHKVDGDTFIQGRAAFREEFSEDPKSSKLGRSLSSNGRVNNYFV